MKAPRATLHDLQRAHSVLVAMKDEPLVYITDAEILRRASQILADISARRLLEGHPLVTTEVL
jgi:hypothetical protein